MPVTGVEELLGPTGGGETGKTEVPGGGGLIPLPDG